jgi:HEAT repeat protein
VRTPPSQMSEKQIGDLVESLDSLQDGDLASDMLVACGKNAIPYLSDFLLNRPPRTISLPRCRAVRALGELGACSTLVAYFKQYARPQDGAVLFAEDAVRSAAARELARYPSAEIFWVLLEAARDRATGGLVLALGDFHRPEAVPVLFEVLEDDFCREDAKKSLRKLPEAVRQFGILSVRGLTGVTLDGPGAVRRRRATVQLLSEVGVSSSDWLDLRKYLSVDDASTVVATARIGFVETSEADWPGVIEALFKIAGQANSLDEEEIEELLDAHAVAARRVAMEIAKERQGRGEKPHWLSPHWRLLNHSLGRALETRSPHAQKS